MPIYEYVCTHCGEPIEKLQKLSDAPLTDCPACGEAALKRKISAAGFRLAGGGWYETDFKADNRRNLSGDGKEAKASSTNGESSSSESSSGGESKSSDAASKPSTESNSAKPAQKSSNASSD